MKPVKLESSHLKLVPLNPNRARPIDWGVVVAWALIVLVGVGAWWAIIAFVAGRLSR